MKLFKDLLNNAVYKMKCCIVIPLYKVDLNKSEIASLKQIAKVLPNHNISFVGPIGFDFKNYLEVLANVGHSIYDVKFFSSKYFVSVFSYNRLMLAPVFYRSFTKYDYILIYQLDAWIFSDQLDQWCNSGYDYIGAPWFHGMERATQSDQFAGVGNGGFSLRKIQSHLRVLRSFKSIHPLSYLVEKFLSNRNANGINIFLENLLLRNNFLYPFNKTQEFEDVFWGKIVPKRFNWFKVPDEKTAMSFSMEVNASLLYEMNNKQLPFGCHAWEKYDPSFWSKFIKIEK